MADVISGYFVDDYIASDYFDTITLHDASANLTASATATVDAFIPNITGYFFEGYILEDYFEAGGEVQLGESTLASSFTAITDAGRILGTDLIADSAFTNIVDAGAIRSVDADLSGAATFGMTALLSRPGDITLVASSSMVTDAGKIHSDGPILNSDFTTITDAGKIHSDGPILNSTFTNVVEAFRIRDMGPTLDVSVTLTADNIRITNAESAISSDFALSAEPGQIESVNCAISSSFAQTTSVIRTTQIEPILNTNATQIVDASSILRVGPALTARFAVGNIAGIIGDYGVIMQPTTAMNITAIAIRGVDTALTSSTTLPGVDSIKILSTGFNGVVDATQSSTAGVVAHGSSIHTSEAALNSTAYATRDVSADLSGAATFGLDVIGLKPGEIYVAINSTMVTDAQLIANTSTAMSSAFTVPNTPGMAILRSSLSISTQATLIAEGRLFVLNDIIVYVVPREQRLHTIKNENRIADIEYENRNFTVRSI